MYNDQSSLAVIYRKWEFRLNNGWQLLDWYCNCYRIIMITSHNGDFLIVVKPFNAAWFIILEPRSHAITLHHSRKLVIQIQVTETANVCREADISFGAIANKCTTLPRHRHLSGLVKEFSKASWIHEIAASMCCCYKSTTFLWHCREVYGSILS